jgi:hypothetical protein
MSTRKRFSIHGSSTESAESGELNQTAHQEGASSLSAADLGEESTAGFGEPTDAEIAARAYEYWQERGGVHGSSEEDWHRAEQDLRSHRARTAQPPQSAAASA